MTWLSLEKIEYETNSVAERLNLRHRFFAAPPPDVARPCVVESKRARFFISIRQAKRSQILNAVDEGDEQEIAAKITNNERREVIAQIKRKYREHDFRHRVLTAYAATCAFCGVQLKLVEAAHIIPVASDSSTDETINGIALCSLHHRAYDQNLVSFDENYRIEISGATVSELHKLNLAGGLAGFQNAVKNAIILPADKRDYPAGLYILESRKVRLWGS